MNRHYVTVYSSVLVLVVTIDLLWAYLFLLFMSLLLMLYTVNVAVDDIRVVKRDWVTRTSVSGSHTSLSTYADRMLNCRSSASADW